jgi:UDP-GlcNAc:undecaprenyl-phosphate GlcNAc-1-phosphate transferase
LTFLVAFLLAATMAAALTPLVRRGAFRLGILSRPGGRHVHERPVPRLGGVAIFLSFAAPVVGLLVYRNDISASLFAVPERVIVYLGGSLALVAVGAWDDVRHAGPWPKLLAEIAVAAGAFFLGFRIDGIATPFGPVTFGIFALPVTVLWITGIVNAVNLIDGLDGLASGVATFALLALFGIALSNGRTDVCLIIAALGGALVGFLVYNFNPATIFMGDSGSLMVGFLLATMAIDGSQKTSTVVALLIPMLALGVPILDMLVAVARRSLRGDSVMRADREHIHHRLLDLGLTQRQAVTLLYGACVVFTIAALAYMRAANFREHVLILLCLGLLLAIVFRRLGVLQFKAWRESAALKRETVEQLQIATRLGTELAQATRAGDDNGAWLALRGAAELTGAEAVALVWDEAGVERRSEWTRDRARPGVPFAMPVPAQRVRVRLEASFAIERTLATDAALALVGATLARELDAARADAAATAVQEPWVTASPNLGAPGTVPATAAAVVRPIGAAPVREGKAGALA